MQESSWTWSLCFWASFAVFAATLRVPQTSPPNSPIDLPIQSPHTVCQPSRPEVGRPVSQPASSLPRPIIGAITRVWAGHWRAGELSSGRLISSPSWRRSEEASWELWATGRAAQKQWTLETRLYRLEAWQRYNNNNNNVITGARWRPTKDPKVSRRASELPRKLRVSHTAT